MFSIFFNILVYILETLFCYIILNSFLKNNNKKKIALFFLVMLILCLGDFLLNSSILKHIYYIVMFFILLKIFNAKTRIVYTVSITITLFAKYLIEFITVCLFFNKINFNILVIIFELLSIVFALWFGKNMGKINHKFLKWWNSSKSFYFRYLCLIGLNLFVLFILYNLMLIKEVL
jgi:hypothetical protein